MARRRTLLVVVLGAFALLVSACSSGGPRVGPPESAANLTEGASASASASANGAESKLTAAQLEQYFEDAAAPEMDCTPSASAWDYECHFTNPLGERVKLGVLVNECAPIESTGWVAHDAELPAPSEVWEHAECHDEKPPAIKPPTPLAEAEREALVEQKRMVRLERQFISLLDKKEKKRALRRKALQLRTSYRALAEATDRYRVELAASLGSSATLSMLAPYRTQAKGLRLAARGVDEFRRSLKNNSKALARRGLKKIARGEALLEQAGEALDAASNGGARTQRLY